VLLLCQPSATISRDPSYDMSFVLPFLSEPATDSTPIITPITFFDEILGPDKGKISVPSTAKNTAQACMKSEKILSKFWADDLDTDQASDNTLELDNSGNKAKHKASYNLQSPRASEYECIHTRAKSGISKAYKT